METRKIILKIVFILAILLFIPLVNFRFYVFNLKFYEEEFTKLNIYEKIPRDIVLENTKELLSFLKDGKELKTDFFNEKEKLHLQDVRYLIKNVIILFYITLIALIFLLYINRNNLHKSFIIAGTILIFLIIISYFINFEMVFIWFHKIAFTNTLWLLGPETDNLIKLFPMRFFQDFIKKIFLNSFIFGVLLICSSLFLRKFKQRQ